MFIELTRRSDGKKIRVSKHAIGYMEEVGIIEWKKEGLFKKGEWVEDTKDRFTELNILGKSVYVEETIQEIEEMINEKPKRRLTSKQIDDLLDEIVKDDVFGNPINYFIKQEEN
nr:MAG TPA: Flagellar and Swarming motility protein [Caudoviricetes sp.]